jgi:hypothetical protein
MEIFLDELSKDSYKISHPNMTPRDQSAIRRVKLYSYLKFNGAMLDCKRSGVDHRELSCEQNRIMLTDNGDEEHRLPMDNGKG